MRAIALHRGWPKFAFVVLLLGVVFGCDGRYEIKEDKEGRIIRLDKWLGGITILEEGKLIPVVNKTVQQSKSEAPMDFLNAYQTYKSSKECEAARNKMLQQHPAAVCVSEENYVIEENGKKLL